MKRNTKIILLLAVFSIFAILSRFEFILQLMMILYVMIIFLLIWVVIKLLKKPDTGNRVYERYFIDEMRLKYKNKKNV